jgi:glycosyltransferase involved in cell wall biosynthesis
VASVVVSGLLHDGLGLAEAARGYARAFAAAGLDVRQHVVELPGRPVIGHPGPQGVLPFPEAEPDDEADVVVCCLNPPEMALVREARAPHPAGRVNVGVWAWEVDPAPVEWAGEAGRFDEVWTHSTYVADLLRPVVDVPVVALPPPVQPLVTASGRSALLDGRPTFLALADAASTFARKNPLGAIEAFSEAFTVDDGQRLVVKVWNGQVDEAGVERLRQAAVGRPDIAVVDQWLPRDEFGALLAGARCLVALHRAEGFGLPIFEAFAHGVPVVTTGFSGPMDLIDDRHAFLVGSSPAEVPVGAGAYPAGTRWVEPDHDHAVEQLRAVANDHREASARAGRGQQLVRRRLTTSAVGARLRHRVEPLLEHHRRRSPRSPLRPSVGVVVHAAEPWPALAPFLAAVAPQVEARHGELVVGVSDDQVLPDAHRPKRVRAVPAGSTSPFSLRRAAIRGCDADLVVVTEDHCRPAPGWLLALDQAFEACGASLLAGPIGNGSTGSTADWANYLMGFVAYAPPIDRPPTERCPTVANCAIAATALTRAVGRRGREGVLEREIIPELWADGDIEIVPDALVYHQQSFAPLHHARNHFDDARVAGAHQARLDPTYRPSLRPAALRDSARGFLRGVVREVTPRVELVPEHARAATWLRLLAVAKALGLAVGARVGEGRSGDRLD